VPPVKKKWFKNVSVTGKKEKTKTGLKGKKSVIVASDSAMTVQKGREEVRVCILSSNGGNKNSERYLSRLCVDAGYKKGRLGWADYRRARQNVTSGREGEKSNSHHQRKGKV